MSEPELTLQERAQAFADAVAIQAENLSEQYASKYRQWPEYEFIKLAFQEGYLRRCGEGLEIGEKEDLAAKVKILAETIEGNWDQPFVQRRQYDELMKLAVRLASLTLELR